MSCLARTSGLGEWLTVKEIEICGREEHFMLTVHCMWLDTLLVWRVGFLLAASTCCDHTLPFVDCVNVCYVCVSCSVLCVAPCSIQWDGVGPLLVIVLRSKL